MTAWLLGILAAALAAGLQAQRTTALPDLREPHQTVADGNGPYVLDEADCSLHVYTLSPFAPKLTIGRKGDDPHDFKCLPYVVVQAESLVCTDFVKAIWFSRKGEVLKAMPFSEFKGFDPNSEMLLLPVGDQFVRITADHARMTRYVDLVDSTLATGRTLYEGPFVWMQGSRTDFRTDTVISGRLVFVSDTFKG
jgi:hypothetical protein